jgi:hypothetical protein
MRLTRIAICATALLLCSTPLGAKGSTTKILLSGDTLDYLIEISDRAARFMVWSGPGTYSSVTGPGREGFIN